MATLDETLFVDSDFSSTTETTLFTPATNTHNVIKNIFVNNVQTDTSYLTITYYSESTSYILLDSVEVPANDMTSIELLLPVPYGVDIKGYIDSGEVHLVITGSEVS